MTTSERLWFWIIDVLCPLLLVISVFEIPISFVILAAVIGGTLMVAFFFFLSVLALRFLIPPRH